MKQLVTYIRESLEIENGMKVDISQLYDLYKGIIDIKSFAINCDMSEDTAEEIDRILKRKHIFITSTREIKESFEKDVYDKINDSLQAYADLGIRYRSDLFDSKDADYVKMINSELFNIDENYIEQYFWKKTGEYGYLIIVVNSDDEIQKLIDKI